MNKRILFSACVLAACLGACTNDDFTTEKSQGTVESNGTETVIGADLVSEGMKIRINDGATTRVTDGGAWEVGIDKVGMGWYNYGTKSSNIFDTQDKDSWWAKRGSDNKMYANHIFSAVNNGEANVWETTTDVYQGAYFMYFPYEDLGEITEKHLKINSVPQTTGFETDRLNKGLRLSAQQFIKKGQNVDPDTKTMTTDFIMIPVVNTLRMEMAPEEAITNATGDAAVLKGLNIAKVEITTGGVANSNNVFVKPDEKVVLHIGGIPTVQTVDDTADGTVDTEKTLTKLVEAAENATDGKSFLGKTSEFTLENKLSTTVENPEYTLAANRQVRAFAFPIPDKGVDYSNDNNPWVIVSVGPADKDGKVKYVLGSFLVNAANNSAFTTKLRTALDGKNKDEKTSLAFLLGQGETWNAMGFTANNNQEAKLLLNDFTVDCRNITTVEQWNDLVAVYDALYALKDNIKNPEFVWEPTFVWNPKDDKQVFDGAINTPKNVDVTLRTADGKALTITGDVTWPKNLLTKKDVNANIVVAAGAKLTVGELTGEPSTKDERVNILANVENNGIIYAGKNATIGAEGEGNGVLDNTLNADGKNRVIVTYGAYVYPTSKDEKGVIAYEVTKGDAPEVTRIQLLVGGNTNAEYANVNTLIVKDGVELDLNAKGTTTSASSGYPYEDDGTSTSYAMPDLTEVDIELEGGSVVYTTGTNKNVKNVYNVSGDGSIEDIQPLGNIEVKGGKLSINTKDTPNEKALRLMYGATIQLYEKTTLDVNTDVYATYVNNAKDATIDLRDGDLYLPTRDNYKNNEGTLQGGELQVMNNAEATAVATSFTTLKSGEWYKNTAKITDLASFVTAINGQVDQYQDHDGDKKPESAVGFYNLFNDWLVSVGEEALSTEKGYLTTDLLTYFQNMTGITFEF